MALVAGAAGFDCDGVHYMDVLHQHCKMVPVLSNSQTVAKLLI